MVPCRGPARTALVRRSARRIAARHRALAGVRMFGPRKAITFLVSAPEQNENSNLSGPTERDDFWIRSRPEVLAVLTRLGARPTTITAYFNRKQDFILTAILGLQEERNLLILDEGPSDELNAKLILAGRAACVAVHDHVRVRFECTDFERAHYDGRPVFVCPIPTAVYYVERRECFRVATSVLHPPLCYLPQPEGDSPLVLPVVDISAGGVGLHDVEGKLALGPEAPDLFRGCRLHLPDYTDLTVDLRIKNHHPVVRNDGKEVRKIGAMFVDLRPGTSSQIQQYVNRIQLSQIALTRK